MTSLTIFNNDTSTQLNTTSFSYLPSCSSASNPSILFDYGTSGIYNATANSIIFYTSGTTALTIDTNQCLYGNGTGLTNIGYNNIIGKPSFFPTDWNTTVSNKPDLTVYATNTNLNSLSSYSYLNISENIAAITNLNNKTNFTNLYVNGESTLLSSLNVSCFTTLNNNTTFISSLNVSGLSILSNNTTINGILNVSAYSIFNRGLYSSGYIGIGITASSPLEIFNPNYPTFKLKFGGIYAPNRMYSTGSFRLFTSYPYTNADIIMNVGTVEDYNIPGVNETTYMNLNTQGLTLTRNLNVSNLTRVNNATTIISSLNVSGNTTYIK
jgi:hypothetical protein